MVKRNTHLSKLHASYLFAEIARRKQLFLRENPTADLINLGIGDTTEPIPKIIAEAMAKAAADLTTREKYVGYDPGFGKEELRNQISSVIYRNKIFPEEIFVTDGSKPDIGRLQLLFSQDVPIALQDPSYPAYIASSVIAGKTGAYDSAKEQYHNITLIPCTTTFDSSPDFSHIPRGSLIFFCSPNNPTGITAGKKQLEALIAHAQNQRNIVIFDSAYSSFIRDNTLPRSLYELEGGKSVAIETGSFSKMAGFTGVRLGWIVVPKELTFDDGTPLINDWKQIAATYFNGASHIAQVGGLAALTAEGQREIKKQADFYLENGLLLKKAIEKKGYQVFGGDHAPYLWVKLKEPSSWKMFDRLLQEAELITTPGCGFGPGGEGFLRFSAFGQRENILRAVKRIEKFL